MCQVGCLVSSVAMALTGTGHNYNPSTLNAWLKANKGYTNKDDFVWASINTFGLTFEGKIPNSLIRLNLDVGYVLIINVKKGAHWVLATSYNQNTIYVKDSLYNVESYDISEVRTPYTTGERKQLVTSYIGETIMSVLDESAWQGRFTDRIPVSYYEYMDMLDACAQAVENESVDIDPSLKTLLDIY